MVWREGGGHRLAPALETLLDQLYAAYPGGGWPNSPQTGTLGNLAHQAEATSSDHNPWLDRTVRALDAAANVQGVAGIQDVSDAPDCEALFRMVNEMYGQRDPRVFPDGYAIYLRRITDWNNPGGFRTHSGDPHLYHLHVSVSTNPAGYDSTEPWPLPTALRPTTAPPEPATEEEHPMLFYPEPRPGQPPLFVYGRIAVQLRDGASIRALKAAGVPSVPVSERDFAALVKASQ